MTAGRIYGLVVLVCLLCVCSGRAAVGTVQQPRDRWVPGEIIVKFKPGVSAEQAGRINQAHKAALVRKSKFADFCVLRTPPDETPARMVQAYRQNPQVEYAERNYLAYAFFTPNDPYYSQQWNFHSFNEGGINMPAAWDVTTGDPGVIVAVLDTGVAYENYQRFELASDLAGTNFVPGYNFVAGSEHANDDDGHGTHVTGTVAQSTNNSHLMAGIAFGCSVMPVKVLGKRGLVSSGSHADIADGIYFAADNGAAVINMSLGGPDPSATLENAIAYAYSQGVTIVCAAGNAYLEGNATRYPAAYDDYCIAVAATTHTRSRASYSNTGSYIDIAAPGGDLSVPDPGFLDGILQQTFGANNPKNWDDLWLYAGTSMAAPHVSGVAALLVSNGVVGPDAVREAIEATAVDLGPAGWDEQFGAGLLDAYAALNYYQAVVGDISGDGAVDWKDVGILSDYWLTAEPQADIAPAGGDGIVNMLDFAVLAGNWLAGVQ